MNRTAGVALVLAIMALAGYALTGPWRYRVRMTGKPAPNFKLTALDGETVQLSDFRGKPVVLAFWAYG